MQITFVDKQADLQSARKAVGSSFQTVLWAQERPLCVFKSDSGLWAPSFLLSSLTLPACPSGAPTGGKRLGSPTE